MVVPSEKNTDIIDLSMEELEFNHSALKTLSNNGDKDPPTPEKIVDRDKSSEVNYRDDSKTEAEGSSLSHIPDDAISSFIDHSQRNDSGEAQLSKSESVLSLEKSDAKDEFKVLGDANILSKDQYEETSTIVLDDRLKSTNDSILEPDAEGIDVKAFESTLYETIETTHDYLEETPDVFDHIDVEEEGFRSSKNILGDRVEELSRTPPRLATPSPLLTSTPHSLPPLSRSRAPSSPSPLPPTSLVDMGPLSLPTLPGSGSKSYDYLLKVLLVGDSDVGKQEILSGLEDGSVDSPYCSSTGAGEITDQYNIFSFLWFHQLKHFQPTRPQQS